MEFNNNQFNNNDQRVGCGIIAVSVLEFIGNGLGLLGIISLLVAGKSISDMVPGFQMPSVLELILSIIISIASIVSLILLLQKKKVGVIGYFAIEIINIILNIIASSESGASPVCNLILPIIMGILVYRKKHIFGF